MPSGLVVEALGGRPAHKSMYPKFLDWFEKGTCPGAPGHKVIKFYMVPLIWNDHALFWAWAQIGHTRISASEGRRLNFFFKLTAMVKFVIALITNLSSKSFSFLVICKKLN